MKTIILFITLLTPLSLFAGVYPITITNSGNTNDLVIIPTVTSFPCFASPNGLSIPGDVAVITPNTSRIYTFTIPVNILLECANMIRVGSISNFGFISAQNDYSIGTTLLNSTYQSAYGITIQYTTENKTESYGIYPISGGVAPPSYMTFSSNNHEVTINADLIPETE